MKILVILIIFVFALSLFRMILEWSKNNNSSVESVDAVVSDKIGEIYQQQIPNAGDPTGSHGLYRKSKLFSQNGFGFLFCCYKSVTTAIQNLMYN